jgi:hypothetical protein
LTGVKPEPLPLNILHSSAAVASTAVDVKKLRGMDRDWLAKEAAARATTPGGLEAAIRGDLEAILAKSLQVDPRARFQSAQEMSEEFRRYLLGYPVRTRPVGRLTRVRKWALRNKLAAGVGCVLLLAILFSAVGVAMRARDAARKRQIAQTRLHDLVRLTDVLAGELYQSLQGLEGSETAQAALLDSAHQTVDKLAAEQDHDAQLDLELAREYEKLARLEVSRKPLTAQIERRFEDDLDKEILMLNRLRPSDPEARRMRDRLPEMMQLRSAAQQQVR